MTLSKTQRALKLVESGMTVINAAKETGISSTAVYNAIARAKGKTKCSCCGQVLRKGFVDKSVKQK